VLSADAQASHPRRKKGLVPEVGRSVALSRPARSRSAEDLSVQRQQEKHVSIYLSLHLYTPAGRLGWDFHAHRCKWRFLAVSGARRMSHARQMPD
jgi:hypothetical protein